MDWQPISKLAQQLSQTTQSINVEALSWDRVVINAEGLWRSYAKQQSYAWPLSLRPPRTNPPAPVSAPRPVVTVRQPLWQRLFRFWRRPRPAPAPVVPAPPVVQPPDLVTALTECYMWLNAQILQQATQWFSPYWTELPAELAVVSERAVMWTLYAWALQEKQIDVILQDPFLPATKFAIAVDLQPGDALCLHINLERLMQSLPSDWQLRENSAIAPRPGGLRSEAFLRAYAMLSSFHVSPTIQDLCKAVDRLIEGSPLTQIIYVDWVNGHRLPDACADVVQMKLNAATNQDLGREAEWRDLWYAQLARCLLGALLSEAPVFAELQEVEQRLQRIESPTHNSSQEQRQKQRRFGGNINAKLPETRQQYDVLRRKRATQYLERLERTSSLFQNAQRNRRCTYLQVRLLDMLLHHVVVQAMPTMIEEWRRLDPETNPWARTELFNEGGACFNTFIAILFGNTSFDAFLSLLGQEQKQSLRQTLETLLDLPRLDDLPQWATEAGVRENAAARAWARFSGEPVGGIPLPLPAPNDLAPAPQSLLADWLPLLLNRLPQVSVAVVASGAEYATVNDDRAEPYSSLDY